MDIRLYALLSLIVNFGLFWIIVWLFNLIDKRTSEAKYLADLWDKQRSEIDKLSKEIEALHLRSQFKVEDKEN